MDMGWVPTFVPGSCMESSGDSRLHWRCQKQFADFRRRHRKPRKTIQKKLRVLKVSLSSTSAGTVMSVDSLSTTVPASPSSLYRFQHQRISSVAEPLPPLFNQSLSILFDWSSDADAGHETSAHW